MKRKMLVIAGCVALASLSSCEKIKALLQKEKPLLKDEKSAVCVGNDVPFIDKLGIDAGILTFLTLGETVHWTGDSSADGQHEGVYYKVKLSDEQTQGWVSAEYIVRGAVAGAVKKQTRIYNRPDTLTVTEKLFEFMDMIAVTAAAENKEWLHVVGEGHEKAGWVRNDDITLKKEDVASAIFARKKLKEKNDFSRMERLDYIALNAPFLDCYFIDEVRKMRALESIFYDPHKVVEPPALPAAAPYVPPAPEPVESDTDTDTETDAG